MNGTPLCVAVLLLVSVTMTPVTGQFYANLRKTGFDTTITSSQFQWILQPVAPVCDLLCDAKGILKMVPPSGAKGIDITMELIDTYHWTFHIAQNQADNGYGGSNTEVHNLDTRLMAWRRQAGQLLFDDIDVLKKGTVRIEIKTAYLYVYLDGNLVERSHTNYMFAIPNWTLYMGMNRITGSIAGGFSDRQGHGLCSVSATWTF